MEKDFFALISQEIGLLHLTFGHVLMWLIAGSLIYLAIKTKGFREKTTMIDFPVN